MASLRYAEYLYQMNDFSSLAEGGDLRSLMSGKDVVQIVKDQKSFDALFNLLFHHERILVMRAADAVEKITRTNSQFLKPHKNQLLSLLKNAVNKELKWHVAQLIPRVELTKAEMKEVWGILTHQTQNPNESKIVRVNSLQALYAISLQFPAKKNMFEEIMHMIEHEPYPSIQARVRKLRKVLSKEK